MLKIYSQLGRALQYQSAVGTERIVGHFDDGAKDLAGPSGGQYREVRSTRLVKRQGECGVRQMRARVDPSTGSIVGYFSDETV